MVKELYCPKCGSSNVVGYKRVYECFDCGYKWSKTISRRAIPLWVILASLVIAVAIAVPATWYLIAQGRITIKAAPEGAVTVETIQPTAADLGNITLNPGETAYFPLVFKVRVEERPFYLKALEIGYNPCCPPKLFSIASCRWGASIDSMNQSCFESYSAVASLQEDNWSYYEYKPSYHATDVVLDPGEYYFNITLGLDAGYPDQDITFDFRIYADFEKVT